MNKAVVNSHDSQTIGDIMKKESKKIGAVAMAVIVGASALVGAAGAVMLDNAHFKQSDVEQAKAEAFKAGVLSVDVTADNDEAFRAGVASVDIKEDNQAAIDKALAEAEPKVEYVENTDSYDKLEALLAEREIFDDAYSVLEQLEAEDEARKLAVAEIKAELAEELEDADLVDDEDDVDDIDIEEDYDDVEVLKSDFEDEEYRFVFQVEFEDEDKDEKFDVLVTVEVEEGHAKIKKVVLA